ncbi:MFS transporter [Micromonospora sp. NPDC050200]|uniref:MFS transporter n=1 Tax=Micromonospora sp. NPDC050200 TaxID=3155664 RepID=UPI0033DDBD2A
MVTHPHPPARWSRAFRQLYAVSVVGSIGQQVALLAVPVLAVGVLRATPGQVGLLGVLGTAAFLLIGLPAGVWVDRADRRTVMIVADLVRSALFASVPLAWWAGWLTIGQLYLVVLLAGAGTVFFDVAEQSYLPAVVGRERLVAANSLLVSTGATIQIGGRALGGFLVQLIGAPVALVLNAAAYLVSALVLTRLRRDAAPARQAGRRDGFGRQLAEGVRHVLGNPLLRPLALSLAGTNLTVNLMTTMLPVVFLRELGLGAATLGLFLGAGGVGALLGAVTARPLADRIGHGPALWLPGLVVAPLGALVPLIDTGPALWLAGFGWLAIAWRTGIGNVIGVSLRQRATPDALLGRMNAVFRFLLFGAIAVGAALSGLLGQYASLHTALWIGAAGTALTWLPIFCSPLRALAEPPTVAASPREAATVADASAPSAGTGR